MGNPESAADLLAQLDQQEIKNPEVLSSAAESYLLLGDKGRALVLLEKALRNGFPPERVRENPAMAELLEEERIKSLIGSRQEP